MSFVSGLGRLLLTALLATAPLTVVPEATGAQERMTAVAVVYEERAAARVSTKSTARLGHRVAFFPSAARWSRFGYQGFARVVNRTGESGEVRIEAWDDAGLRHGPVTLAIGAHQSVQFNSADLETGNADVGLSGGIGAGTGDWRLRLSSSLELQVLSYIRTREGFLTSMHDLVAESGGAHRVVIFNPGRNRSLVSWLRVVNAGTQGAEVRIEGIDATGASSDGTVEFSLAAGTSRMLSAQQLESGEGEGLSGSLGTGQGKWQLVVSADAPIEVMSLLSTRSGHLTNLSTAPAHTETAGDGASVTHAVAFFPSASQWLQRGYQGFARVVNRTGESGEVRIEAWDDAGLRHGPVTLAISAHQSVQFNSADLETGNADVGLSGGIGAGTGDWRLRLSSRLDLQVLSYIRTREGFLTSMHDLVAESEGDHRVVIFNPGRNRSLVSRLRVVNAGSQGAEVRIEGIDASGESSDGTVELSLAAGASRMLSAQQLESGEGEGLSGALGTGQGKWQLVVSADAPIEVMSLLATRSGHLANLSTAPAHTDTVDYSRPSHDLQASRERTNWLPFTQSSGGAEIAYGDFDGDGDEDVILQTDHPDLYGDSSVCFPDSYCFVRKSPLEIWENVGSGFARNTQKFFSGNVPEVVNIRKTLIGDFNGDGKPDIFLATHGPAAPPLPREEPPFLFLSTDNGFVRAQGLDHLAGPGEHDGYNHGAASADIDQDGDLDIFITDWGPPYFLINDGNGNLEQNRTAVPSAIDDQSIYTAELVDVDDDGYPDLLVGGHEEADYGPAPTAIYWGDSSGEYSDSRKTILPEVKGQQIVVDIDVGDLDHDGNKDIVVNRTDSSYVGYYFQIISGLGNRTYSDTTSQSIEHGADATGLWVVWIRLLDVNGDGSLDITVDGLYYFGATWLNDGSGRLTVLRQ